MQRITGKTKRYTMNKLAKNTIAIITALSLVFLQTPLGYAAPETEGNTSAVAADAVAANGVEDQAPQASDEAQDANESDAAKTATDEVKDETAGDNAAATDEQDQGSESAAAAGGDADEAADGKADDTASTETKESASDSDDDADKTDAKADKDDDVDKAKKRVYTYSDSSVKLKATLDDASAISDDAKLSVTAVTPDVEGYDYDAYMKALNADAAEGDSYTDENTLLYDVAFLVKDEDGKVVEQEPASGTVAIEFTFKNEQLTEGLGLDAKSNAEPEVKHLALTDDVRKSVDTTADATNLDTGDIRVSDPLSQNVDGDKAEMQLDSLSVVSLHAAVANAAAVKVSVRGIKMAHWYTASGSTTTAESPDSFNVDFDAQKPFSYDEAGALYKSTWYPDYYNEKLKNPSYGGIWQCVGFVPGGVPSTRAYELFNNWCVKSEDGKTVQDARDFVTEQGGILYGEVPTDEQRAAIEDCGFVVAVWYVLSLDENTVPKYNYGSDGPQAFVDKTPVAYNGTTDGVTATGEAVQSADGNEITYVFTIPEGTDDDIINLDWSQILTEPLVLEPGDTNNYTIKIIDKSGNDYVYVEDSGAVGTVLNYTGDDKVSTGFEGYGVAQVGHDEYSQVARRGNNSAITNLYDIVKLNKHRSFRNYYQYFDGYDFFTPDDDVVGAALYALGYGSDYPDVPRLDNAGNTFASIAFNGNLQVADEAFRAHCEAITKSYLDDYYLDWANAMHYADAGNPPAAGSSDVAYKSFKDIPKALMNDFFQSSNRTQVFESNAVVVNGLYYGFYEYGWPVRPNAESEYEGLHTVMADENQPNKYAAYFAQQFADSAEETDEGVVHTLHYDQIVDGEFNGNNMQNTKFSAAGVLRLERGKPSANLEFDKFLYGGSDSAAFDFVLTTLDQDGNPRTGETVAYTADEKAVEDTGDNAFTITVTNSEFEDGAAQVCFPKITYGEADADYRYRVEEGEDAHYATDDARYIVTVSVRDKKVASITYELQVPDGDGGYETVEENDENPAFYNNEDVALDFESAAYGYVEGQQVMVFPHAKKYLDNNAAIEAGQFEFELRDASGQLVREAKNDENGDIAFYEEGVEPGLVFDEPGTYTYYIVEIAGNDANVSYDPTEIVMDVTVTAGDDGALSAEVAYSSSEVINGVPVARFDNQTKTSTSVKVRKVSREDGKALEGSTYGLYMKDAAGQGDALIAEGTSDANGWIVFRNVDLNEDRLYYFKEIAAPSGHTVDPFRTAYLQVKTDSSGNRSLAVAEKTAADKWHAASYDNQD